METSCDIPIRFSCCFEVTQSAAAARAVGDEDAAKAWERGIGKFAAWIVKEENDGGRDRRDTMLLDTAAVETMWAAAARLSVDKDEIARKLSNRKDD